MQSFELASAFVAALGATGQLIDWRAIHDTDKAVPAIPFRDTLENAWSSIIHYNNHGYGVFATIAAMDGNGRELANVAYIRAHYVDLDNVSAQQTLERAAQWQPSPSFAVSTSPSKYHVYWPVTPYIGNDRFQIIQRKLRQYFDGDKSVIDATRVMRVPGTYHLKSNPHLVTCFALPGYGFITAPEALEQALAAVNIVDTTGQRYDLGEPSMASPGMYWLQMAMNLLDPNTLDRGEWIATTAAIKQSGWTLVQTEQELFDIWSAWCARYANNDPAENLKQWKSIRQTEVGWNFLRRKVPGLQAYLSFDGKPKQVPETVPAPVPEAPPMPAPPGMDCSGELLNHIEQQQWFAHCYLISSRGEILTPGMRYMNSTKFNAEYGGKKFIIDQQGKVTNEAWQAATRSTLWTIPKADHIRFLPSRPFGDLVTDDLGRTGINTYKPARIERRQGDVSPFLNHLAMMLPNENDRRIILQYIAHNAKFPGYKIPWAPVIQSAEGIGKGVLKHVIECVMGPSYVYFPNAKEMVDSGSKFNAWMRAKLFILADEIKVDERRDMIEVLKPMISEERIEIQAKGHDQEKEDNFANWAFFTNYKDAIPINKNARRFAIFYSAIQSLDDLRARVGDPDVYFPQLYGWLKEGGGSAIVADYLLNYPVERGIIPMRAPETSSTLEAIHNSRGPIDQAILDAIADGLPGFRGGWVSSIAVAARIKAAGLRSVSPRLLATILEGLGMFEIGRAPRSYFAEDAAARATLYSTNRAARVEDYGRAQGYE